MNDTILGLWAAVDAGWSNSIDRHLFGLLHDAYLDAGDQVSADGIDWCVRWDRIPTETKYWNVCDLFDFASLTEEKTALSFHHWIPCEFNGLSVEIDIFYHDTPSAAYLTLLRAWALMTQETRDLLMNAKGTVSV